MLTYQRRLDRAVDEAVEVAGTAVGDGSRRAGGDQVAHKRAVQSNILYLRSPTRVFADPQVRAVASTVVASPPFSFPLSMRGPAVLATCAQEICVSNNTEKKEVVSDKCHKIRFYFRHV
jgi:hypothetical protein